MAWLEKRDGTYRVCWRDASGKRHRTKAYTDKLASKSMLAELEKALARGEQGLVDPYKAHKARPLKEHVADYIADLKAMGRDDKYCYNVERRLTRLMAACAWTVLPSIKADSFCSWRENPGVNKRVGGKYDHKIGPRTLNQYLQVARSFCNWTVKRKRAATNPLIDVGNVDETADVRRARRALHEDDLVKLLDKVPAHFLMVYRFMLGTGLRRQEVEDLLWGDIRLNSPTPFIKLRAKATKARRSDVLPLRADMAAELRTLRGEATDGDKVFAAVPTIEEHREYLTAAGIDWTDSEGRRADIHALRHTYGTLLSKSGATPRETMELMRHTDMRLTMKVYTDPRIFNLTSAVEKLPLPNAAKDAEGKATGTDGQAKKSG
jgi:integrase